jgi:hypothetical protein
MRDLRLLGQEPAAWLVRKIGYSMLGLGLMAVLSELEALGGHSLPWQLSAGGALALGSALYFVPDVMTRANAKQRRSALRHALARYLDLVALEPSGGASPARSLEAAAELGGRCAFSCISEVLSEARMASRQPWDGLARLGDELGAAELRELAELAELAEHEGFGGAGILETLNAPPAATRAQATASAGARSSTAVAPIALPAGRFRQSCPFEDHASMAARRGLRSSACPRCGRC